MLPAQVEDEVNEVGRHSVRLRQVISSRTPETDCSSVADLQGPDRRLERLHDVNFVSSFREADVTKEMRLGFAQQAHVQREVDICPTSPGIPTVLGGLSHQD